MRRLTGPLLALLLATALIGCSSDGSDADQERDGGTTTTAPADGTTSSTTATDDEPATGEDAPATGDAGDYADALAVGLTANSGDEGELEVTDAEAACVAPAWIEIVGVDTLVDAEVAPAELEDSQFPYAQLGLEDEQGLAMIDAFGECDVDVLGQIRAVLGADLDAAQRSCLDEEFGDDLARRFLAETLTQPDLSSDLSTILDGVDQACDLSGGG